MVAIGQTELQILTEALTEPFDLEFDMLRCFKYACQATCWKHLTITKNRYLQVLESHLPNYLQHFLHVLFLTHSNTFESLHMWLMSLKICMVIQSEIKMIWSGPVMIWRSNSDVFQPPYFILFLRQKADRPMSSICQVERRFHSHESNHQPLPWDLGISPPSSSSLRSSRTINLHFMDKESSLFIFLNYLKFFVPTTLGCKNNLVDTLIHTWRMNAKNRP